MGRAFGEFTPEERRENGRKGGLRKGDAYKKRKELKDTLNVLLEMPVRKGKITDCESVRAFAELKGKNISVDQALMVTLVNKGLHGDLNAISMIRDTIGEKPTETVDVNANITKNPLEDLSTDELRELINNNVTD